LDAIKFYGLPFVIDFGSDSCIPCKEMAPVLEILHEDLQGKAIVHFVDVWKNTTAANDFPVSVIPTQVFFNADGTPFIPSDELAQEIEFTMYSSNDTKEHVFTVHQGGVTEEQMRKIFAEMGVE
jgi:thioredoxin 1